MICNKHDNILVTLFYNSNIKGQSHMQEFLSSISNSFHSNYGTTLLELKPTYSTLLAGTTVNEL